MPRCLLVFEPPDGGVAENVMRLALGLREHGWEPWVAGPRQAMVYPSLRTAGVPIARLSFRRGYGHPHDDARALWRLVAVLSRRRFDLVHLHSAKAGVLGRLAARATGTPAVYSPHCFPFVGEFGFPRRAFALSVERALGPWTDALVCVAEDERRLALGRRLVAPEHCHVVHNGSPPCAGVEPDGELRAFAGGSPLAACLTVLRAQKAVHVFLEAAPSILGRVPEARLAVVGNGDLRGELEARARALGVDGRLRFFDFRPPAARQLRSTDVFVLPSAWEAFPISVLEAMACGVPQVATDVGGTREAVSEGETGFLCPPNDPEALADRVAILLSDHDRRRRMGEASRHRHERSFRVEEMVRGTASVYDRLAGRRGSPQSGG